MNEKSNKTAVDWLIDQLQKSKDWHRVLNEISQMSSVRIDILQHAKEMEKQQIIESWDNGFANGYDLGKHDDQPNPDDAEQYYNETYGK